MQHAQNYVFIYFNFLKGDSSPCDKIHVVEVKI